jgi:endo-1,4-beta-D-glucanase Y
MSPSRHRLGALLLASALAWAPAASAAGPAPRAHDRAGAADDGRTSAILAALSKAWFKGEWDAYRARFVSPEGRVIDNANGDISHSEGQGYGLLLALAAGDDATFATIWRWTGDHLRKRPDALFAWTWDPERQQVADFNNASDGDILIAWALARAGQAFGRSDYDAEARNILEALASKVITASAQGALLLPAASGFAAADQQAGPVVNLSYWIFGAFRDFARLDPGTDWDGLRRSGYRLLDASRFGRLRLPADWIALGGSVPAPASNLDPQFGYGAIRIPLYIAQDPDAPREALARFAEGSPGLRPAVIDAVTGTVREPMHGVGYRMIFALARCAVRGDAIPPELMSTRDGFYYPETLRLLCIAVLQERLPQCL